MMAEGGGGGGMGGWGVWLLYYLVGVTHEAEYGGSEDSQVYYVTAC